MRRHGIICFAILVASCSASCSNKADVETAKRSLYNTDFSVVYSAALSAVRDLYPTMDDAPGSGQIKTAWHQVPLAANQDDMAQSRAVSATGLPMQGTVNAAAQNPAMTNSMGQPTRLVQKRYYVRFDVSVLGGRPWRVKVVGHASEWDPGAAMPTEMRGAQRPPWLDGRTDTLTLAIYNRIKAHAVPMKQPLVEDKTETPLPKTDPTTFNKLPADAGKRLAHVKDMASRRDYASLRLDLAEDVVFSLGAEGNAEVALAMWQADPEVVEAMAKLVSPQCAVDPANGKRVLCPGVPPKPGEWQLVLEQRGEAWLVTSFVRAE